jgi:hypothetical protein
VSDNYDLIQTLLRYLEAIRWKDEPLNDLSFAWKEGYETAIDNAMNELRREL